MTLHHALRDAVQRVLAGDAANDPDLRGWHDRIGRSTSAGIAKIEGISEPGKPHVTRVTLTFMTPQRDEAEAKS